MHTHIFNSRISGKLQLASYLFDPGKFLYKNLHMAGWFPDAKDWIVPSSFCAGCRRKFSFGTDGARE